MMKVFCNVNRSGKLPPMPSSVPGGVEVAFDHSIAGSPKLVYLICADDTHAEFIQPSEYFARGGSNSVYALLVTSAPRTPSLPVYRVHFIMRVLGMSQATKQGNSLCHTCVVEPYARPGQEGVNYYTHGRTSIKIFADTSMVDDGKMLLIPSYDYFQRDVQNYLTVPIEWRLLIPEDAPRYCVFEDSSSTEPKWMIPLAGLGPAGTAMDTGSVLTNKGGRLTVGPYSETTTLAQEFTFRAVADALGLAAQGVTEDGKTGIIYWFCIYKEARSRAAQSHIMRQGDPASHASQITATISGACWGHLYYDLLPYSQQP